MRKGGEERASWGSPGESAVDRRWTSDWEVLSHNPLPSSLGSESVCLLRRWWCGGEGGGE